MTGRDRAASTSPAAPIMTGAAAERRSESGSASRPSTTRPAEPGPALLDHAPSCPQDRVEMSDVPGPHRSRWEVVRCLGCGAQATNAVVPPPRLVPGTPDYLAAWRRERTRLVAQLDHEDWDDPTKNPMHPRAEPAAPEFQPRPRRRNKWHDFPARPAPVRDDPRWEA